MCENRIKREGKIKRGEKLNKRGLAQMNRVGIVYIDYEREKGGTVEGLRT